MIVSEAGIVGDSSESTDIPAADAEVEGASRRLFPYRDVRFERTNRGQIDRRLHRILAATFLSSQAILSPDSGLNLALCAIPSGAEFSCLVCNLNRFFRG